MRKRKISSGEAGRLTFRMSSKGNMATFARWILIVFVSSCAGILLTGLVGKIF